MFNIGFTELIVVLLVAFLIVGPKDLPKVARWFARQIKKLRSLVAELKRETGWNDLVRDMEQTTSEVKDAVKAADVSDDLREVQQSVQGSLDELRKDIEQVKKDVQA